MLLFVLVVVGLVVRGMAHEERVRVAKAVLANLVFLKDAIVQPPSGDDSFHVALKARTRWAPLTPAIAAAYFVVFALMVVEPGTVSDPQTLTDWGANIGPRTTNGEWWRLVTATFTHAGMIHLLAEMAGLVQVGLLAERLVGSLAFGVVYLAAGALASVWTLNAHPLSVQTGAAGAIFGVYGLLAASLLMGQLQRSTFTVPLAVLKGLLPGVAVFTVYHMVTEGLVSDSMKAGLMMGFTAGMVVAGRMTSGRPPVRRVCAVSATALAIVFALAAPLRGIADVTGDVARVKEAETRTAKTYDAAVDRFKNGRMTAAELASLADGIGGELKSVQGALPAVENIPAEQGQTLQKTAEYLRLRRESWRLRAEGLRAGHTRTLQQADAAEQSALSALDSAVLTFR